MTFIVAIVSISTLNSITAQTVIWSEDFDGNSGAGNNWGLVNQDIGVQGASPNQWYVSCAENGNAVGVCGTGCGANNTLHVGSTTVGDLGAAYDAGCDLSCFFCSGFGFCSFTNTDRRSQSNNINTVGDVGLTLNFNYIENGDGVIDNCFIEYSINGGTSWITLSDPAKTVLCAGGQGQWTAYSVALPATCENIPNLRIAFRWQNNADGVGTDPSFAVNDITITKAIILPIDLLNFKAIDYGNSVTIKWTTLSELNNAYFTLERSEDGIIWDKVTEINGAVNSSRTLYYQFIDDGFYIPITYYRLKQTDFNGDYFYSEIVSVVISQKGELLIYPNPTNGVFKIQLNLEKTIINSITITNQFGEMIQKITIQNSYFDVDISAYHTGIYFVHIVDSNGNAYTRKIVKQ